MSHADLLVTTLEQTVVRVEKTGPRRVWLENRDDHDRIHAHYDTTAQARAASLAFGVPTAGVTFPVRIFIDRTTTVVLHDHPRGAHRAPAPHLYPKGVA